jgi:tetratricopeptide (TPR) repeat protein
MLILANGQEPGADTARLRRHASGLETLARAHYHRSALAACADCYLELERVAHALDDEATGLRARFWYATALHGLGRHEEALVAMEHALDDGTHEIDEPSLYLLWTRALRAEIELPRPLAQIEATFQAIEHELRKRGIHERRSRLLLNRARLALSRGRLAEAIEVGEEALACRKGESHTYTLGAHYWPLVAACTWAGELPRARRHLEEWRKGGEGSRTSTVFLTCRQAELERRAGRLERALAVARDAWAHALATDEHQLHIFSGHALVQAQLALGRIAQARGVLAWLLRHRHCEFGEHAHVQRLLVADLALAEARRLGGLRALDADFGREHARPRGVRDPGRALLALERARRLYDRTETRGRALDELLECHFRSYGLAARRALVSRTRDELRRL